jgi:hypothetical protein
MARIRTIKPSFFTSFAMAEHPLSTRLTFVGLWTYVDDEGRGPDDPRLVKAALWPLDDDVSVAKVEKDLVRLANAGQIIRYEFADRRYLQVTEWSQHQRINRPTPSVHPVPFTIGDVSTSGGLSEGSVNGHGGDTAGSLWEGNREQGTGRQEQGQPPTPFAESLVDNFGGLHPKGAENG